MGKFKTTSRGGAKFVYKAIMEKGAKHPRAWKETNLKTGKSKEVGWGKAKSIFAQEYDKAFAKRISKRKKGVVMNYTTALAKIKEIRKDKKHRSFDELY